MLASATVNTDFAEIEVDTRRTNLTRFPLFFPENRTFFLEGDDIFAFGLGLSQDVLPYFSRRIGLVGGQEVPIIAGGKVNGRSGNTNFGGLVIGTNDKEGVIDDEALMTVGRVKQNLWRESWVGAIATVGDPLGQSGRWLTGGDFTYATSRFRGDKNFLVGAWGLATDRTAGDDATAGGFKVDYPNDKWDVQLTYKRVGRAKEAGADTKVLIGDARLTLERQPPQSFDLLVIDAFSSDAIPTHLLTSEAVQLYFRHLAENGVLAVHISNRYLDLEPVCLRAAEGVNRTATVIRTASDGMSNTSLWVLITSNDALLRRPQFEGANMRPARAPADFAAWTDQYSSVWSLLDRDPGT